MALRITDTTLRDAHQSLIATRMRLKDILPIAADMDLIGFFSLEAWGGATFDSCLRFLNEDPWERLRTLRQHLPKTPLQMLLRGQNLVGYRHYADDVVAEFIRLAIKNGVGIFRIFDALNDIRNMDAAIRAAKEKKAHVQGTICYTVSPVHTVESFVDLALSLEGTGCDSLCVKDMAGLLTPQKSFELIRALKKTISLPISLHSHCTSGVAPLSYLAAIQAGVDIVDTALGPFSGGTSQPPTESIVAAFQGTEYDTGLKLEDLAKLSGYFATLREKFHSLLDPIAQRPDIGVFLHQVPGGMLSNLLSQLKKQKRADLYPAVLQEIPRVRERPRLSSSGNAHLPDRGNPGRSERDDGQEICASLQRGEGVLPGPLRRTPGPIDPENRKRIIGQGTPIEGRPADQFKPQLGELKREAEQMGILKKEEDLITYALYPNTAPKFLKGKMNEEILPAEGRDS